MTSNVDINDYMSNNLPLCHWWKHTKFIHKIPLWWWLSPMKLLSPFDINGKWFLPLWSTYVCLHDTNQSNEPWVSPPAIMFFLTRWIPLSIFSLCLWILFPFVSKGYLFLKNSLPVSCLQYSMYTIVWNILLLLWIFLLYWNTAQMILEPIHWFSSISDQMYPYLSMMLLYFRIL